MWVDRCSETCERKRLERKVGFHIKKIDVPLYMHISVDNSGLLDSKLAKTFLTC